MRKWIEHSDYVCMFCKHEFSASRRCIAGVPDAKSPDGTSHVICPNCDNIVCRKQAYNTTVEVIDET